MSWLEVVFPFTTLESESICIQPFWKPAWPNGMPSGQDFRPCFFGSVAEAAEFLLEHGQRWNLGVAASTFQSVDGVLARKKANFLRTAALVVDLDCGPDKSFRSPEEADERLLAVERQHGWGPGAVVSSGSGLQACFRLEKPTHDKELLDSLLPRLSHFLSGDPSSDDIVHVFRPPATRSFKYRPPREVRLLRLGTKSLAIDDLQAALPLLPAPKPWREHDSPRSRRTPGPPHRPLRTPDIEDLLNGKMPERYNGDESRRDFFVAATLLEQGHSHAEAIHTMANSRLGVQAQARKHDPSDYIRRTVESAAQKVARRRGAKA